MALGAAGQLTTPVERVYAGVIGDLMQRFAEMGRSPYPPSADRLLRWTLLAGRNPEWVADNARDLRLISKAGMSVKRQEFERWYHSIQNEISRPTSSGETLSDWYDRLRRLHALEFPTYRDEPYWRWADETRSEMVNEGRGEMYFGLPRAGKTATCVLSCERDARLKDEQIAHGSRSTLAQMVGKKIGKGGTPDSDPDPDPSHLGLWYARDLRFISNFTVYDDPRTGVKSPIKDRWVRCMDLSEFLLKTADCEERGYFVRWIIDEGGFAVDKFTQGSEKVKAIVGTTRVMGKLNGTISWITQFGPDDFPKELVKSAETKWMLASPHRGRAQGRATVTVPGSPLHERVITDIPLPVSGFDTTDRPALRADIRMKDAMEFMSLQRQKFESTVGAVWGRMERAQSLRDAVAEQLRSRVEDPEHWK